MWLSVVILVSTVAVSVPSHLPSVQTEMNRLFADTGVQVEVRIQERVTDVGVVDEVVHLSVIGACQPVPQAGPLVLASVEFLDGEPRPLMKLECDRLTRYIQPSRELGVAMGRVLAHELLHYLLSERGHSVSKRGGDLFYSAVSADALTRNTVTLPPDEVRRLQGVVEQRLAAGHRAGVDQVGSN